MKNVSRLTMTLIVGTALCWISTTWANPPSTYLDDTGATYQGYLQGGSTGYGLVAGGTSTVQTEVTDWIRYDVWANDVDQNGSVDNFTYQYTVRLDADSTDRNTVFLENLTVSISALQDETGAPIGLGHGTILGTPEYWTGSEWTDVSLWAYFTDTQYTNIPPAVSVSGEDPHDDVTNGYTYSYRFDSEYVPRWGDVEINLLWYTDGPDGENTVRQDDNYFENNAIGYPPNVMPPEYPDLDAVAHPQTGYAWLWQGWRYVDPEYPDVTQVIYDILTPDSVKVPEPTSATLLGLLLATGLLRRTRRRRS